MARLPVILHPGQRLRIFETAGEVFVVGENTLRSAAIVDGFLGKSWIVAIWETGQVDYFNVDHVVRLTPALDTAPGGTP